MSTDNSSSATDSKAPSSAEIPQESAGANNGNPTELALSRQQLKAIPDDAVRDHAATATKLDLSDNQISSLKNLDRFTKLGTLILDRNGIKHLSALDIPSVPSLHTVWLNNNDLHDLKGTMDVLARVSPGLSYLSMLKNPAVPNMYFSDGEAEAYHRYRYYVIFRLKKLKLLDASPVEEEEVKEAERVGKFMTPAKPVQKETPAAEANNAPNAAADESDKASASSRPAFKNNKPPKAATFLGRGRPRYDGSNSEGNRFISNDDL